MKIRLGFGHARLSTDFEELGFPGNSEVNNLPAVQETRVQFLGWEDPLFLPGESHGQESAGL